MVHIVSEGRGWRCYSKKEWGEGVGGSSGDNALFGDFHVEVGMVGVSDIRKGGELLDVLVLVGYAKRSVGGSGKGQSKGFSDSSRRVKVVRSNSGGGKQPGGKLVVAGPQKRALADNTNL